MCDTEHLFHPGGLVPGAPVLAELLPGERVLTLEQGRALARTAAEGAPGGDAEPT